MEIIILKSVFKNKLHANDVPAFRAALIEETERKNSLFHNHKPDGKSDYRYPLIQYKLINQHPSIIGINQGADALANFFTGRKININVNNKELTLRFKSIDKIMHSFEANSQKQHYIINDWLALNEVNYNKYKNQTALTKRIEMLEKILTGNILSFASGIDCFIGDKVFIEITDMYNDGWMRFKNKKFRAFTLSFNTNMTLPVGIGLGKGVSKGYGTINIMP